MMNRAASWAWLVVVIAVFLTGCASYGEERVAPVPLPEGEADAVTVGETAFLARAYLDPAAAREAFGFDIRGAGLLPVQFVVDNGSSGPVRIDDERVLLEDRDGNAWPVLSARQAEERVRRHVEQGEAVRSRRTCLAAHGPRRRHCRCRNRRSGRRGCRRDRRQGARLPVAPSGLSVAGPAATPTCGREIRRDLAERSIRDRVIAPGELAYGFMFFPGAEEATSVRQLRLTVTVDERSHALRLPMAAVPAP
ncbi:MAG: hypothetical protein U5L11_09280 [Arhodomonas sp.]|nr:hypothetical protein [Arhodomonas sp.]